MTQTRIERIIFWRLQFVITGIRRVTITPLGLGMTAGQFGAFITL